MMNEFFSEKATRRNHFLGDVGWLKQRPQEEEEEEDPCNPCRDNKRQRERQLGTISNVSYG